jgi:hypothetical protein
LNDRCFAAVPAALPLLRENLAAENLAAKGAVKL